jgi:hypothetical protein
MKSREPPINGDERRWFLLAFICVHQRFQHPLDSLGALGVLGGSNKTTLQVCRLDAIFFISSAKLL